MTGDPHAQDPATERAGRATLKLRFLAVKDGVLQSPLDPPRVPGDLPTE